MPDPTPTITQAASAAATAAGSAKTAAETARANWNATKNAMINWLKTNVGSSLDAAARNFNEALLAQSISAGTHAKQYLKQARDHLVQLTSDPDHSLTYNWTLPYVSDGSNTTQNFESNSDPATTTGNVQAQNSGNQGT